MYFRISILTLAIYLLTNIQCEFVKRSTLGGLYPPVFTPMDHTGALNVSVIPEYAQYLKNCGLDGVVVADIVGEGESLSVREKMKLLDQWVIAAKPLGLKVFVQVGGIPLPEMLELAKYAETIRVDALITVPPYFFLSSTIEVLITEIELLAKATSLPIFFYDNPDRPGEPTDIPEFFELASEKVPQFKGLRATLDVASQVTASTNVRVDQLIFMGRHREITGSVLMGFDSFIISELNIFPGLVKEIITYTKAGDLYLARKTQEKLNKAMLTIINQSNYVSAGKAAMEIVTGIKVGRTRPPLEPISKRGIKNIKEILEELDIQTV